VELSKDGLVAKMYCFGVNLIGEYKYGLGSDISAEMLYKTDICTLVKTAFFKPLFIYFMQLLTCVMAISSIVLPFYLFGAWNTLVTVGIIAALLAAVTLPILLIFCLKESFNQWEIVEVAKVYVHTFKDKFCPIVTFVEKKEDESCEC
jgi:hypothetical protein